MIGWVDDILSSFFLKLKSAQYPKFMSVLVPRNDSVHFYFLTKLKYLLFVHNSMVRKFVIYLMRFQGITLGTLIQVLIQSA